MDHGFGHVVAILEDGRVGRMRKVPSQGNGVRVYLAYDVAGHVEQLTDMFCRQIAAQ